MTNRMRSHAHATLRRSEFTALEANEGAEVCAVVLADLWSGLQQSSQLERIERLQDACAGAFQALERKPNWFKTFLAELLLLHGLDHVLHRWRSHVHVLHCMDPRWLRAVTSGTAEDKALFISECRHAFGGHCPDDTTAVYVLGSDPDWYIGKAALKRKHGSGLWQRIWEHAHCLLAGKTKEKR